MSGTRWTPSAWSWAFLLVACLGCGEAGEKLYPVKGSVTVDGQPAEGVVLLFFHADEPSKVSTATSDASGAFTVVSDMKPGMPGGSYTVTASWPEPAKAGASMGATPDTPDRLGGRYAVKGQSTIKIDVADGTTSLPAIELSTR
jgi:hypothetical protein